MAHSKSKPKIRGLNEVGRYAIGVQWVDGHDSIFPLENLRRGCMCDACKGSLNGDVPPASMRRRSNHIATISRAAGGQSFMVDPSKETGPAAVMPNTKAEPE